jgi:hypothetical protein
MASQVDIANICLGILGMPTISNLVDNSNFARIVNAEYDLIRRQLLEGPGTWRFSIKRASLPVLATAPVSGPYTQQYALPTDCIRPIMAGDTYPGMDLSDYLMGPTDAGYSVEGRNILCDYGAPLSLVYVGDITDTTQFNPWFCVYFGAEMAWNFCERLTSSDTKQEAAKKRSQDARSRASASNAFVNTPSKNADDTWVLARLQ